jgi:DNA-directed RNA polymerase subunit RPC12/RpoP
MSIEIKSPNASGTAQVKCPKCKCLRFNVHTSELTTGKIECSNCGHEIIFAPTRPLRPLTDRAKSVKSSSEAAP